MGVPFGGKQQSKHPERTLSERSESKRESKEACGASSEPPRRILRLHGVYPEQSRRVSLRMLFAPNVNYLWNLINRRIKWLKVKDLPGLA
jgi:hypothetical protein